MSSRISNLNDIFISFFIKFFIIINLLFPYVNKINYRNCTFILSNFIVAILIILLLFRQNIKYFDGKFVFLFFIVLLIYNIFAFINNYKYNHYFIEQINKSISFIFYLLLLMKVDYKFIDKHKIIEFLFGSEIITLILSLLYRVCGGDAIQIQNCGIMLVRKGTFGDDRLTWVFGHKSTYALLILLFIAIAIKFKNKFKEKKYFVIFMGINLLTAVAINSITLIAILIIVFTASYLRKIDFRKNRIVKLIVILLIVFLVIGVFFIFIKYISTKRSDLGTVGNRVNIYRTAIQSLPNFPNGVGKEFGNVYLYTVGETIENMHNIFLNEMFRFSVKVGVVYFILHLLIVLKGGMKDIFNIAIVGSCYGLFFMDYALRTEQLSIYIFLIFIILNIIIPGKEKSEEKV